MWTFEILREHFFTRTSDNVHNCEHFVSNLSWYGNFSIISYSVFYHCIQLLWMSLENVRHRFTIRNHKKINVSLILTILTLSDIRSIFQSRKTFKFKMKLIFTCVLHLTRLLKFWTIKISSDLGGFKFFVARLFRCKTKF